MPLPRAIKILCSQAATEQTGTPSTPWPVVLTFVTVSLCIAFIEHLTFVPQLTTAAAKTTVTTSAAVVGVAAYCLLSPASTLKNFILISVPYLFVMFGFLCSSEIPTWDTHDNHFPLFQYVANSIAEHAQIPTWLPISGGIDFGIYHINYFPFLPHRLAGYLIYSFLPVSIVTAFKIQLLIGVLLFSYGWYAVVARITRCQHAAFWGTFCILMGGTGITLHQEQVIASCHLLPWFIYCLLKSSDKPVFLLPASALFGMGMSSHYPQIQLISMSLAAIAILLCQRPRVINFPVGMKTILPLMCVLFFMGCLPSLYVWHYSDGLSSGVRASESLQPSTYDEYMNMNQQQMSSAPQRFFSQYAIPVYDGKPEYEVLGFEGKPEIDSFGMFIGRISLLLLVLAIVYRHAAPIPTVRPFATITIAVLAFIFAELTLGINSHIAIPKVLFYLKFPFISVFRQWYHFFPFINFCVSLLAAIGFVIFRTWCNGHGYLKYVPILLVFLNIADLSYYDYSYVQLFAQDHPPAPLQKNFTEPGNDLTTFMYRDRFLLNRDCSKAIPTSAFVTTNYLTTDKGVDDERAISCGIYSQQTVATNIPEHLIPGTDTPKSILATMSGKIFPWGIRYSVVSQKPALFVSELNYSLPSETFVDDKPAQTWRVNSALNGLLLTQGQHSVTFRKSAPLYFIIVCIQTLLYVFVILSLTVLTNNKSLTVLSKYVHRFRHDDQ